MPVILRRSYVQKIIGFQCDKCHKTNDELDLSTDACLHVKHTFGYGSKHDMDRLEFVICDNCLVDLLPIMLPDIRIISQ